MLPLQRHLQRQVLTLSQSLFAFAWNDGTNHLALLKKGGHADWEHCHFNHNENLRLLMQINDWNDSGPIQKFKVILQWAIWTYNNMFIPFPIEGCWTFLSVGPALASDFLRCHHFLHRWSLCYAEWTFSLWNHELHTSFCFIKLTSFAYHTTVIKNWFIKPLYTYVCKPYLFICTGYYS